MKKDRPIEPLTDLQRQLRETYAGIGKGKKPKNPETKSPFEAQDPTIHQLNRILNPDKFDK